jgi:hypothetical protein
VPQISYSDLAAYIDSLGPTDLVLRFCGREIHAHRSILEHSRPPSTLYSVVHAAQSGTVVLDYPSANAVKGIIAECYGLHFDGFDTYFKCSDECSRGHHHTDSELPTINDTNRVEFAKYLVDFAVFADTLSWMDTGEMTRNYGRFRHCLEHMRPTSGYPTQLDEIIRHVWTEYHQHEAVGIRNSILKYILEVFAQMLWISPLPRDYTRNEDPRFERLMIDCPGLCYDVLKDIGWEYENSLVGQGKTSGAEVDRTFVLARKRLG